MGDISQTQIDVAERFANSAIELLGDQRGVHAETAIAATARMAGTFLFRSFGFQIEGAKPGQAVLSELANEHGPRLVNILGGVLEEMGITPDQSRLDQPEDPENEPKLAFLETQKLLEPKFNSIRENSGLSHIEAADSAAIATAIIIQQCAEVLDPSIAFGIAVYGFIEGSKSYPATIQ
jgi:hypothetical protein